MLLLLKHFFLLAGFLLLAYATARLLSLSLFRWGFWIDPKWLFWVAVVGLVFSLSWLWVLPFRGFLVQATAMAPEVSLAGVANPRATGLPHVVKTAFGYRATFQIALPLLEQADLKRETHLRLRPLLQANKPQTYLLFEEPKESHRFKIDPAIEPHLVDILDLENERLAGMAGQGTMRFQVCLEADPEEARGLAELGRGIEPMAWQEFGSGFHPPSPWSLPGAMARDAANRASGIPGLVETGSGLFLPLLIVHYSDGYVHAFNHHRCQQLAETLDRPVLWSAFLSPFTAWDRFRIAAVTNAERAIPKGLIPKKLRDHLASAPARQEELKHKLKSGEKPALLKQVVWLRLEDGDHPRTYLARAREWFLDRGITVTPVLPRLALRYWIGLHPGLERFAADAIQGFGLGGEQEEISAELEPLAHWPGHRDAATLFFETRDGKALPFNLFSAEANNYNLIIAGESGSGKSVLATGLMVGHLGRSAQNKALVVDYGGSFSGTVGALGGIQISYEDLGRFRISPIPELPPILDKAEFGRRYPEGSYEAYVSDLERLRYSLKEQAYFFIKDFLIAAKVAHSETLKAEFFHFLDAHAGENMALPEILDSGIGRAKAREADTPMRQTALEGLVTLLEELRALTATNPLIGETNLHFSLSDFRLISFNLDGFLETDKRILVGLVGLLVQQTFALPRQGNTLFLFDEFHKFADLAPLLDQTMRVTRKFQSSLILASQAPKDFDRHPSLLENANHHIVMRLRGQGPLADHWRIKTEHMVEAARTAPAAADAGYSSIHLGTSTRSGDIEVACRYRFAHQLLYVFTSKKQEKSLLELSVFLTNTKNFLELARAVHRDAAAFIPIGSRAYFQALAPMIDARFAPVKASLDLLFADLEANPFLALFLEPGRRHELEAVATQPHAMKRFLAGHGRQGRTS